MLVLPGKEVNMNSRVHVACKGHKCMELMNAVNGQTRMPFEAILGHGSHDRA